MADPDHPPLWGGCEAWPAWADSVAWHALEGDPTVLVMPHLAGTRHRLNYCPSCGADRRSATSTPFPPAEP